VQAFFNSGIQEIKPKSVVVSTPEKELEIENDHVFVMVGGELPFSLLERLGVRIVERET
jgi:thioredoxin reductase (NADPH)